MSSSKLHPGGNGDATPILWRSVGGPPITQPQGPHASSGSSAPGVSGQDSEVRVQAAYQQGVVAGEATAQQRAQALATPTLKNFAAMINELSSARARARQESEDSVVRLAIAIARRVLHREIATDPTAILGLVRSGFDRLNAREIHKLRLSPGDAALIQQSRSAIGIPEAVEVLPDPSLPPGGAVFETTRGELDLSVQTQLEEIERGLTDLVRQRSRA